MVYVCRRDPKYWFQLYRRCVVDLFNKKLMRGIKIESNCSEIRRSIAVLREQVYVCPHYVVVRVVCPSFSFMFPHIYLKSPQSVSHYWTYRLFGPPLHSSYSFSYTSSDVYTAPWIVLSLDLLSTYSSTHELFHASIFGGWMLLSMIFFVTHSQSICHNAYALFSLRIKCCRNIAVQKLH